MWALKGGTAMVPRSWMRIRVVAATAAVLFVTASGVPAGNGAFINVTKVVDANTPAGASFNVDVSCDDGGPTGDVPFTAAGGTAQFPLPSTYQGTCTFTEDQTGGAATVTYACSGTIGGVSNCASSDGPSPAQVGLEVESVNSGSMATVTITNTFNPPPAAAAAPTVVEAQPQSTG